MDMLSSISSTKSSYSRNRISNGKMAMKEEKISAKKIEELVILAKIFIYVKYFASYVREEEVAELTSIFDIYFRWLKKHDEWEKVSPIITVWGYFQSSKVIKTAQIEYEEMDDNLKDLDQVNIINLVLEDYEDQRELLNKKHKKMMLDTDFIRLALAVRNYFDPKKIILESIFQAIDQKKEGRIKISEFKKLIFNEFRSKKKFLNIVEELAGVSMEEITEKKFVKCSHIVLENILTVEIRGKRNSKIKFDHEKKFGKKEFITFMLLG